MLEESPSPRQRLLESLARGIPDDAARAIKVDVNLCDDATHRSEWLMARVVAVKSDGTHIRSADVITADGRSFTRDRRKLVNLEIEKCKSGPSP